MLDQALSVIYPHKMFFCSSLATVKQALKSNPDAGNSRCRVAVTLSLRRRRNLFERFGPRHFFI
jgi:hypothetical protein